MIRREEVYLIGRFNKPHGIHGEVQFTFTDDVFDRVGAEYVVCPMDGILVPFFLEEYRFRSDTMALVKLEGVETAEQARRFTGVPVYFPIRLADRSGGEGGGIGSWSYFVGFTVVDETTGEVGPVVDVDQSTINTLFVVDCQGQELLIPAQGDFVTDIDREQRILYMDLPEGLLSLQSADGGPMGVGDNSPLVVDHGVEVACGNVSSALNDAVGASDPAVDLPGPEASAKANHTARRKPKSKHPKDRKPKRD